ncbi:photoreceptor outer segment membrane glycoprotein 2-like [Ylistrum balloti]|uniref:photoreceptor outer segment membrane glycoprotein 2-like n=1 Tax=Ylistrum balloti TaxID=509963 RepID=UPI00290592B2|nr:photoreceptor outer segment membrane glycoprotein 2-like [Ylistrum balloti]
MCIACNVSSKAREKLAITIGVFNCCIALFGIALIGMALYMKISIESRMMLLDGYDTGVLPHFLLAVGIKVVIFHAMTFKIVYDCSSSEISGRCVNFLFFAVLLSFILVWFLLAGGLMCFTHRSVIEESLQSGLSSVMKRYKTDMFVKVTLDQLQQEYFCCGSNGYSDWFDINWVNEEFLNTKHPDIIRKLKGGLFYSDDVPYSCCDVSSPRPCVHHAVKDKSMHVHYGSVTLYKSGCSNVLMDFFENKILVPTGWSVLAAFGVQFVTVVLMRYLQTSLTNARDMEDPEGDGTGYCLPGCPCDCCSAGDPMKYMKRKKRARDDAEYGMDSAWNNTDPGIGESAPGRDFERRPGGDKSKETKDKNKTRSKKDKKDKKVKEKSKDKHKSKSKTSPNRGKGSPKSKKSPGKKTAREAKTKTKKSSPKIKKSPRKTSPKSLKKPKSPKKMRVRKR